jgi:hypothetical protein
LAGRGAEHGENRSGNDLVVDGTDAVVDVRERTNGWS